MAKYQNKTAVLDAKLDLIINNADKLHLVSAYTAGDSYATVVGNSLGSVDVVPGDWTKADHTGNGRKATLALLSANATTTTTIHRMIFFIAVLRAGVPISRGASLRGPAPRVTPTSTRPSQAGFARRSAGQSLGRRWAVPGCIAVILPVPRLRGNPPPRA